MAIWQYNIPYLHYKSAPLQALVHKGFRNEIASSVTIYPIIIASK